MNSNLFLKCKCGRLLAKNVQVCPHCGTPVVTTGPILSAQPTTSLDCLENARDSMDATIKELQAANKLGTGVQTLLVLDLIDRASVIAARIRAIIAVAAQ